jgi:hypothetical protein
MPWLSVCPPAADGEQRPDTSAAVEDLTALAAAAAGDAAAAAAAAGTSAAGSSERAQSGLPLPQQLVAHTKQELLKLGFDVGAAPPFPEVVEEAAAAAAGSSSGGSGQPPALNAPPPIVWS